MQYSKVGCKVTARSPMNEYNIHRLKNSPLRLGSTADFAGAVHCVYLFISTSIPLSIPLPELTTHSPTDFFFSLRYYDFRTVFATLGKFSYRSSFTR